MRWSVKPLDATFGAVVEGIELATLTDDDFAALYALWLEHALLIFPEQHLDNAAQSRFAQRFGELEFDTTPISNVRRDGSLRNDDGTDDVVHILRGNMGWHCDSTYMPVQAKGAVFTAHVVPERDGGTEWADMRAAYDALAPAKRSQLERLCAYHSLYYSQAKVGHRPRQGADYTYGFDGQEPPLRPLVKVHPETGRPALAVGRHAYGIPSLTEQASEALLDELIEAACQPPRIYEHRWRVGDAVVWDNRCLMHRARPWDMTRPRVMYHTRIAGDPQTESGVSASA